MADFCQQCSITIFGEDMGDLANLLPVPKHMRRVTGHVSGWQEQHKYCICGEPWPCDGTKYEVNVLCEGCGPPGGLFLTCVDQDGKCVHPECKEHGDKK